MVDITLNAVSKDFPGRRGRPVRALAGVNLTVAAGEWLSVLGPSGSGKTTLLRLVAGLEPASAGSILIGSSPMPPEPADLEFGFVFQRDALLPHLTARENIALGLRLRGVAREEIAKRVAEADRLMRLGSALDRLPQALSGGERQRTAVARALVRRPRALLLDEPWSALDSPLRHELRGQLQDLHRQLGTTVIHVTHEQSEALSLGQRVAVLHAGVIQQVDTPSGLYAQPANTLVASFVGSPPMNLFRGHLARESGTIWFHADSAGHDPEALALCLTEAQSEALSSRLDRDPAIVLGLRAEDIVHPGESRSRPYGCEVRARLDAIENLGRERQMRWRCGPDTFVQVQAARHAQEVTALGDWGAVIFDLAGAQFFDARTGQRLAGPDRS